MTITVDPTLVIQKHHLDREGDAPITTAWSNYVQVLDKGFVRLESALAADLDPANAARVSFGQRAQLHDADCPMTNRDREAQTGCICDGDVAGGREAIRDTLGGPERGVINFLAEKRHGTPFEHAFFRFEVKAPLFVFREWHRHRIGVSINEQSGRYMQLEREFYVPAVEDYRVQKGRPGAYHFEQDEHTERIDWSRQLIEDAGNRAFDDYEAMLEEGVAKEIARIVLPLNTYSTMWWSCNPRSLMAFLSLRNAPDAQREIKMYAQVMETIAMGVMPESFSAFVEHGRRTP